MDDDGCVTANINRAHDGRTAHDHEMDQYDPHHPQAYTSLALALRASPGHTQSHLACAELLAAGGDHEQAIRSLQAAWEAAPGDAAVQAALGAAMTDMGALLLHCCCIVGVCRATTS